MESLEFHGFSYIIYYFNLVKKVDRYKQTTEVLFHNRKSPTVTLE